MTGDGRWLCAWQAEDQPDPAALEVAPGLVGDGAAFVVSLLVLDESDRLIADDPIVIECRRNVLRDLRFAGSSLLVADPVHVAGAIVLARADDPEQVQALRDDPYQRLGKPVLLHVGPGVLTSLAPSLGPVVERYGGVPWPHGRW